MNDVAYKIDEAFGPFCLDAMKVESRDQQLCQRDADYSIDVAWSR